MILYSYEFLIKLLGGLIIVVLACLSVACTAGTEAPAAGTEAQVVETETPLPALGATPPPAEAEVGVTPLPAQGETKAIAVSEAELSKVDVLLQESFPVQVNVAIQGMLPDGCTSIDRVDQQHSNNNFRLMVVTARLTTTMCMAQRQPFEQNIPLDVAGLAAGTYTVTVQGQNQMSGSFQLSADNLLPSEIPGASAEGQASISGIVWEDTCQLLQDGSPSEGCVAGEQGGYQGDGIFDSGEGRLTGIEISLAEGECPGGETLSTATTDDSGTYMFGNLAPGVYCVFVDATAKSDAPLLPSGGWTYPAPEVGNLTVVVGAGQAQTADFGWDPQFGAPEAGQAVDCFDEAAYVADVTIPDDTIVAPGTAFLKTWRVRNEGELYLDP